MIAFAYTRFEFVRMFRNPRFLIFSIGFPLILFFAIAAPNRNVRSFNGSGISFPLYYMVGLAAFGTMAGMIATGARIANERTTGWTRQLRITPLSTRAYFRAKILTAYVTALLTIALLYLAGVSLGVSMPARDWLEMTGLILIALLPFAALGIFLGHLVTTDSMGPAIGGGTSLFAFLGGTWFPLGSHGFLHDLGQLLPSYWLVQAAHLAVGGHPWHAMAWAVIAVWTAVLSVGAAFAYRRDTKRV
ncbi:MAG TPA: ABC transporter permease [Solirubrobacteraceae bacterium]|nr:ABC transporter permease [Solirubrobacteraceae bacterium]